MNINNHIIISDEVCKALKEKNPVIGIETHGIAHGLPYPKNNELAEEMVKKIIQEGAIPAFIAMIDGKIKVGLSKKELNLLTKNQTNFLKANKQDLITYILQEKSAGLTVSAGVFIANLAGIKIFSTGGIGGVHYGAEETFDISNDIHEIADTPITIVCGGPKIILDLQKTMETLEAYGIPVCGFQTDFLPVFLSRESNFKVNYRIRDIQEAARLIQIHNELNYKSGLIITNPIPEEYSIPFKQANIALQEALNKARKKGISGKGVTIFLLKEMGLVMPKDMTMSLKQLILNNCLLAAKIAVSFSRFI